jgi:cell division septum initiation protein DivIVA
MAAGKPENDTVAAINRVLEAEREMADAAAAADREAEQILEAAREKRRRILEHARQRASRMHSHAAAELDKALAELEATGITEDDDGGGADAALAQAVRTLAERLTSAGDAAD